MGYLLNFIFELEYSHPLADAVHSFKERLYLTIKIVFLEMTHIVKLKLTVFFHWYTCINFYVLLASMHMCACGHTVVHETYSEHDSLFPHTQLSHLSLNSKQMIPT